jgi:hypothetical protein
MLVHSNSGPTEDQHALFELVPLLDDYEKQYKFVGAHSNNTSLHRLLKLFPEIYMQYQSVQFLHGPWFHGS